MSSNARRRKESAAIVPDPQPILAIILDRMSALNYTTHKLAKRLGGVGVPRSTVYNITTGAPDRAVGLDVLAAIFAELGLEIVPKEATK